MNTVATLEAVLTTGATDEVGLMAYTDALAESGLSPRTIARRANRVRRAAEAVARFEAATALIEGDTAKSGRARRTVRAAVGLGDNNSVPVTVVAGDAAPVRSGEAAYSTFRKGGVCNFPGAAIRAGYKVDYHASTLAVTVGADWVAQHCK